MERLLGILNLSWRICLAALGLSFIGSELNDTFVRKIPYDWFVATALLAIGIAMMIPLFRYLREVIQDWRYDQRDDSYLKIFMAKTVSYTTDVLRLGREVKGDYNRQEELITQFRDDYNQFFYGQGEGVKENTSLQNTSTQYYWHTLFLQKKRLDKKKITMSMEAQRMRYQTGESPISADAIFDGKYEITHISEMIRAVRSFFRDGKKIAGFMSKEVARYRIMNAKETSQGKIVCPNCGSQSTREDLIDGCDFCGAKFTVEDLGMRVSDFGLYPDASVEYKKYKDSRSRYGIRVALLSGIPCLCFMIHDTIDTLVHHPLSDDGIVSDLGIMIIITVLMLFIVIGFFEGAFFATLFPILQAKASLTYAGRKALTAIRNSEKHNQEAEEKIRRHDKLFSLEGFYANVQNKLAALHYADNVKQMEAFGEGESAAADFAELPDRYQDIVHMDIAYMVLNDYTIEGELQKADVTANLVLLEIKDKTVKKRNEKIRMRLVKDKKCLTQAVSGPEILHCQKCGSTLSLLDGNTCTYCGNVRHLSKYDWAIEEYMGEW